MRFAIALTLFVVTGCSHSMAVKVHPSFEDCSSLIDPLVASLTDVGVVTRVDQKGGHVTGIMGPFQVHAVCHPGSHLLQMSGATLSSSDPRAQPPVNKWHARVRYSRLRLEHGPETVDDALAKWVRVMERRLVQKA